jgi:delta24-sterol reductase
VISMEIEQLQEHVRHFSKKGKRIAFCTSGSSNTTRSKSYNKGGARLDLKGFNRVLKVDPQKQIAIAEPRVTMEVLVKSALSYGLIPPVVPEFKRITVGGAIMGCAAESGSHKWGIFSDICTAFHLICGDGSLIRAAADENSSLYHAIPGSYGSLGLLVFAEIQLIPACQSVHVRYQPVSDPYTNSDADFLDGIVFSEDRIVMIEGNLTDKTPTAQNWYFEEAREESEVVLPLFEYLFRYDPGAFWMGAYLLKLSFLSRFVGQGLLKLPAKPYFSQKVIENMHTLPHPNRFFLNLMPSQRLWKLHHKAEKWVQDRLLIQDCCIPVSQARSFLTEVLDDPGILPLWLCPIKKSVAPQIFAPHDLAEPILNIGLYGLPSYSAPMEQITQKLEHRTKAYGGRKVLYSRSYYTPEEFWKIYDRNTYQTLRKQIGAEGMWPEITEKVLTE